MSREFSHHSLIAQDLFDRDGTGFGVACVPAAAANEDSSESQQQDPAQRQIRRPKISDDFWEDARRRHCDARQSWRSLLDKFVKPHP